MQYRRLGRSGLQLSELSLGSWVTYHHQVDAGAAREMLAAAMDAVAGPRAASLDQASFAALRARFPDDSAS